MPISDPRDRFFYPHHTPMKDTYCLAHGLGQLTRAVKSNVKTLNFRSDVIFSPPRKTPNGVRKRSLCAVKCKKMKEITNNKIIDFNIIGKKIIKHRSSM